VRSAAQTHAARSCISSLLSFPLALRFVRPHSTARSAGRAPPRIADAASSAPSAQHGLEAARRYGAGQEAAKEWIAAEAAARGIDCDFERCETYVIGETPTGAELARQEADAAVAAGLPAFYTSEQLRELPFPVQGACGFRNQAVFHPRKWLLALAAAVGAPEGPGAGSYVAEHARATGLREASTLPNRHLW
jgi:hypothetical protein